MTGGDEADTEYSYVIRPQGSSEPADDIVIYVQFQDGILIGVAYDGAIVAGTTYDVIAIDSSGPSVPYADLFVCYTPGTLIRTIFGEAAIEDLKVGDLAKTLDHGLQPILWIGSRRMNFGRELHKQRPVEIKAGSLGPGAPQRDLRVSPQHRMLIQGPDVRALFGADEVLVPAIGLTELPGVRLMKGKMSTEYYTLLFERHEILTAEGALSESFFPGPVALAMLDPKMKRDVCALLPALTEDPASGYGARARKCLTNSQTKQLVSIDTDAILLI